jgi:hypothetical protein
MAGVDFIVVETDGSLRFGQCKSHLSQVGLYKSDIDSKTKMAEKFVGELNPTTKYGTKKSQARLDILERLKNYNCAELTDFCERVDAIGVNDGRLDTEVSFVSKRLFFPVPNDVYKKLEDKHKRASSPMIHTSKSFGDFHSDHEDYYGNKPKRKKYGDDNSDEDDDYSDD